MIDPYVGDEVVSMSELRDAQFSGDINKFACGHNFVIGESLTTGKVLKHSPMKRVATSPTKKTVSSENNSICSFSGLKNLNLQHKDLF